MTTEFFVKERTNEMIIVVVSPSSSQVFASQHQPVRFTLPEQQQHH
jgi:hypothetical protein